MTRALKVRGMTYEEFVGRLLERALKRKDSLVYFDQ
jgi:hypothetical protein